MQMQRPKTQASLWPPSRFTPACFIREPLYMKDGATAVCIHAVVWLSFIFTGCHNLRIFFFCFVCVFFFLKRHLRADPYFKVALMSEVELVQWRSSFSSVPATSPVLRCNVWSVRSWELSMIMWVITLTSLWSLNLQLSLCISACRSTQRGLQVQRGLCLSFCPSKNQRSQEWPASL